MDSTYIELNYQKTIDQAAALEEVASNLSKLSDEDMNKMIKEIGAAWEGDNATAYVGKVGILQGNVKKTSDKIKTTAATIRQMAENIRQTELENLRIAMERTYETNQ
ncbi:MAG: WXG100 family type VII secretion target [Lachnospiraceae bacterium]|nr:WXG100 family type VII secretion target [Lachnospiraceae bacterium]MDY3818549.1 WXG100 family type VII secretion target [Lachnospiraceae bacterium]